MIYKSWFSLNLILNATNGKTECSDVVGHAGIADGEVEVAQAIFTRRTDNRTAPIVAVVTDNVERTIATVAGTRRRQFKGGSKST